MTAGGGQFLTPHLRSCLAHNFLSTTPILRDDTTSPKGLQRSFRTSNSYLSTVQGSFHTQDEPRRGITQDFARTDPFHIQPSTEALHRIDMVI
jgi:hypothetical protein